MSEIRTHGKVGSITRQNGSFKLGVLNFIPILAPTTLKKSCSSSSSVSSFVNLYKSVRKKSY